MSHTPGPWRRSGANTVHGDDCIVAFVGTAEEAVRRFSGPRQEADANLIAAAPDLLAALRIARAHIVEGEGTERGVLVRIRAAIAKAERGAK